MAVTFKGAILKATPTKTSYAMGEKVQFKVQGQVTMSRDFWGKIMNGFLSWETNWEVYNQRHVVVGHDSRQHSIVPYTDTDEGNDNFTIDAGYAGADREYTIQLKGGPDTDPDSVIIDTVKLYISTYGSSYVEPIPTEPITQPTIPTKPVTPVTPVTPVEPSTPTDPAATNGGIGAWIGKNKLMLGLVVAAGIAVAFLIKPDKKKPAEKAEK